MMQESHGTTRFNKDIFVSMYDKQIHCVKSHMSEIIENGGFILIGHRDQGDYDESRFPVISFHQSTPDWVKVYQWNWGQEKWVPVEVQRWFVNYPVSTSPTGVYTTEDARTMWDGFIAEHSIASSIGIHWRRWVA
jgi:hypothetical protein